MKVLLVAPQHDDYTIGEAGVEGLANTFAERKLLINNVSVDSVVDAINSYNPDVIWFTSHGRYDGILLDNLQLLTGDVLSSAIRGTKTNLVVINTCESRETAERIYSATGVHVVATIGQVPIDTARSVAQRFAVLLSTGLKPYEAFTKARSYSFIYIPDMSSGVNANNNNGNGNGYEGLRRKVAEQQMEIDRLIRLIQSITTDMAEIMLRFAKMEADQESRFRSMQNSQWVLAGLVIILLVLQLSQVLQ